MRDTFNFSAGPATLPEQVLQQAAAEMLDWQGCGHSVMEMSHRGKQYMSIHAQAEADLRELMSIPANYKILFLQGGATLQFSAVPMNLMREGAGADYIHTGQWCKKAIAAAKQFGPVNIAASSEAAGFNHVPDPASWDLKSDASYVHICLNETIGGVEYFFTPQTGDVPLVGDISSTFLSRPVDVSQYGVLYGGAQKNIGPAGLTIVIVREDLLGLARPGTPQPLDYKANADADSMLNTPPTFAVYVAGLVFQWLKKNGGLTGIEKLNQEKAALLYKAIDQSSFYNNPVALENRSRMNVPFTLADSALDEAFLKGAEQQKLIQLKGHRSVGGMRASIYNAMPIAGVQRLVEYMQAFEKSHG
ncbi:MAG: 3-phosphoserine/phosphohydroxythreonine transaminase [Burkholderiaceae bacterium]